MEKTLYYIVRFADKDDSVTEWIETDYGKNVFYRYWSRKRDSRIDESNFRRQP